MAAPALELVQLLKGCRELFVQGSHYLSPCHETGFKFIALYVYKYIVSHEYK